MNDTLLRLQTWFANQCNGEWEHSYGVRIETIDNPGWTVAIELSNMNLGQRSFNEVAINRSETDWVKCRVRDGVFEGFGGVANLIEIINIFLAWSEGSPSRLG